MGVECEGLPSETHFVIFLGSVVPVSSTSTFWYTLGEFTHLVLLELLVDLAI